MHQHVFRSRLKKQSLSEKSDDLAAEWEKRVTIITAGSSAEEIEPIAALEAEIDQSNRYLYDTP